MQKLRPIPDLLNQNFHFHKILRVFFCTLKCEKDWFRGNPPSLFLSPSRLCTGLLGQYLHGGELLKSTWKTTTRSQIGLVVFLNSRRGSHLAYSSVSLILTKYVILASIFFLSSFFNSSYTLFFLFSSLSPHSLPQWCSGAGL